MSAVIGNGQIVTHIFSSAGRMGRRFLYCEACRGRSSRYPWLRIIELVSDRKIVFDEVKGLEKEGSMEALGALDFPKEGC